MQLPARCQDVVSQHLKITLFFSSLASCKLERNRLAQPLQVLRGLQRCIEPYRMVVRRCAVPAGQPAAKGVSDVITHTRTLVRPTPPSRLCTACSPFPQRRSELSLKWSFPSGAASGRHLDALIWRLAGGGSSSSHQSSISSADHAGWIINFDDECARREPNLLVKS